MLLGKRAFTTLVSVIAIGYFVVLPLLIPQQTLQVLGPPVISDPNYPIKWLLTGGNANSLPGISCALTAQNPSAITVAGVVSDFTATANGVGGYSGATFMLAAANGQKYTVILHSYGPQPPQPAGAMANQQIYGGYVPTNAESVVIVGRLWQPSTACDPSQRLYLEAIAITRNQ